MVKLQVDSNRLYMLQGKKRFQLESATIYKKPSGFEITVFILEGNKIIQKMIKQKKFDGVPNASFSEPRIIDKNKICSFASGSKESPTSMNWYINYYISKIDSEK